jgi:hypothetical protein
LAIRLLIHRQVILSKCADAQRVIKHTFVDLLKRPAARIARAEIINVLDKLARSAKAVTAARSLAYARAAFNWAAKREKVPPECVRPSARRHTVERERVLSDAELAVCGRPSKR